MKTYEWESCPFCGSKHIYVKCDNSPVMVLSCECGCSLEVDVKKIGDSFEDRLNYAIDVWNKRFK